MSVNDKEIEQLAEFLYDLPLTDGDTLGDLIWSSDYVIPSEDDNIDNKQYFDQAMKVCTHIAMALIERNKS